jgi:ankyrin repeat protein
VPKGRDGMVALPMTAFSRLQGNDHSLLPQPACAKASFLPLTNIYGSSNSLLITGLHTDLEPDIDMVRRAGRIITSLIVCNFARYKTMAHDNGNEFVQKTETNPARKGGDKSRSKCRDRTRFGFQSAGFPFFWSYEKRRNGITETIVERRVGLSAEHWPLSMAMIKAALWGEPRVVKLLLEKGADVDSREPLLRATALILASLAGYTAIARVLLDHGADVEARDKDGRTALWEASFAGHAAMVKVLLESGAKVNVRDKYGTTPLMVGSMAGQPELVRSLLDHGAEINSVNKSGRTSLMEASAVGCRDTVELLLASGANPEVSDNQGKTVLAIAQESGHVGVVPILQDWRANNAARYMRVSTVSHGPLTPVRGIIAKPLLNRSLTGPKDYDNAA